MIFWVKKWFRQLLTLQDKFRNNVLSHDFIVLNVYPVFLQLMFSPAMRREKTNFIFISIWCSEWETLLFYIILHGTAVVVYALQYKGNIGPLATTYAWHGAPLSNGNVPDAFNVWAVILFLKTALKIRTGEMMPIVVFMNRIFVVFFAVHFINFGHFCFSFLFA